MEFRYFLNPKRKVPASEDLRSGTPVCRYNDDEGDSVSIVVNGETEYNENEELESNNWYEMIYYNKEHEEICSDWSDIEGLTKDQLQEFCARAVKSIRQWEE